MAFLATSAILAITVAILSWNYLEHRERKMSKKNMILNHWGKRKPVQSDLDKLYPEEKIPQQEGPKLAAVRTIRNALLTKK